MVRQIIWTKHAQKERIDILKFWIEHNKSITFSWRLNDLIKDSLKLISRYPFIGKPSNREDIRVKVLKNYLIIYQITPTEIIVLSIWDNRQNPEKSMIK